MLKNRLDSVGAETHPNLTAVTVCKERFEQNFQTVPIDLSSPQDWLIDWLKIFLQAQSTVSGDLSAVLEKVYQDCEELGGGGGGLLLRGFFQSPSRLTSSKASVSPGNAIFSPVLWSIHFSCICRKTKTISVDPQFALELDKIPGRLILKDGLFMVIICLIKLQWSVVEWLFYS